MQVNKQRDQSSEIVSFSNSSQSYEPLNKQDKNRRFDLLLNKLRYGEKEHPPVMSPMERPPLDRKKLEPDHTSVLDKNVIKRYQV